MLKVANTNRQHIMKKLTIEETITFLYFSGVKNPGLSPTPCDGLPFTPKDTNWGSLI